MAKDFYDKLKVISDIVKDNKVLILMMLTALGSGITNLGQLFASEEDAILQGAMKNQITLMAEAYIKPKNKKAKPLIKYKTVVKETIIKQECSKCEALLREISAEIDKKSLSHVNKLH